MRRKESNLIVNSIPAPQVYLPEILNESQILDPDEALKALITDKTPMCDAMKMIEEDSVLPTYGCEFTFDE